MNETYRNRAGPDWAVDRPRASLYIQHMTKDVGQVTDSANEQITQLEHRLDALLRVVERLRQENEMLRHTQEALNTERASLLEKNETARTRIEAMINRLKAMENH